MLLALSGCEVIGLVPMAMYGASLEIDRMIENKKRMNKVEEMERHGVIPKIDRTDSRSGIDKDQNGIRDDVDAYVQAKSKTKEELLVLEHLARAFQEIQTATKLDSDKKGSIESKIWSASKCWDFASNEDSENLTRDVWPTIRILTANTSKRERRFSMFEKIGGTNVTQDCQIDELKRRYERNW